MLLTASSRAGCVILLAASLLTGKSLALAAPYYGYEPSVPTISAIDDDFVKQMRRIVAAEVIERCVLAANARHGNLDQGEIDRLDAQWRAELEAENQPLVAVTLSNPCSTYLTREQSNAVGLYAAIFVVNRLGINVGQSAPTSDFWQGDEAKFLKTVPLNADEPFIDDPEYLEDIGIWIAQVSFVLRGDGGEAVGAATFDVNLTELVRRRNQTDNR